MYDTMPIEVLKQWLKSPKLKLMTSNEYDSFYKTVLVLYSDNLEILDSIKELELN